MRGDVVRAGEGHKSSGLNHPPEEQKVVITEVTRVEEDNFLVKSVG